MQVTLSLRSASAEQLGLGPDAVAPLTWGPLTVHEKIGSGRFGDVYRATDPGLERDVALKLLRHDSEADGRLVVQEGRLMARVRHPNVATIYGAQRIDGRTGLWMELIDGSSLEAELAVRGPFDAADLARVGIELCRALDAVHRAGLVHRDVKAQNVLIEPGGRVVLGDFGTGHVLRDGDEAQVLVGTPAYLAPEALEGRGDTPSRDLYSLGVLLFHLATGTYPVTGRSLHEIRDAHAAGRRSRLRDVRPDLPGTLLEAVDTALQADPTRRFADAASMAKALEASLPPPPRHAPRRRRGGSAWWPRSLSSAPPESGWPGCAIRVPLLASSRARHASRAFRQISPDPMLAGPGAPSPDGSLLSYVDSKTGNLAVHEIATGRRWHVTDNGDAQPGPGYAETSRFTADGTRLIYLWFTRPAEESAPWAAEIRTIPVLGGEPSTVWRDPDRAHVRLHHWAGDDRLMLVNRWIGDARSELAVIDTEAGTLRASLPVGASSPDGASLSPDGSLIVFDRPDPETRLRDIFIAAVGVPGETPLIRDASSDHTPTWTRDGRFVLFLSDRTGPTALWAQRVDGARPVGPPLSVEPNLGWAFFMGETADGGYFFRRRIGTRDVHTVSLDESGLVSGEPLRASSEVTGANGSSEWSPDGRALTFFRRRDDRWSLVIKDVASGRERVITDPQMVGIGRPRWEADGRSILLKAMYRDKPGVHRLDLQTGAVSMVLPRQIGHYELIPGTRAILYNTRARELSRYDLDTGRTVVAHHIEAPWFATGIAVSRDGQHVAYSASDGRAAVSLRVAGLSRLDVAREIFVAPPDEYIEAYAFTPDGSEVLIKRAQRAPGPSRTTSSRVWAIDVAVRPGASRRPRYPRAQPDATESRWPPAVVRRGLAEAGSLGARALPRVVDRSLRRLMRLRAVIVAALILSVMLGPAVVRAQRGQQASLHGHGHRRHRRGAARRARHDQQSAVDWGRTVSRRGRARHVPLRGAAAGHLPRGRHARRIRDHAARERRGWGRHGGDRRRAAARGGHGSHSGRRGGGASRGRAQRLMAGNVAAALSRARSRPVEPIGRGPRRTDAGPLPRRRVGRSGVRDEAVARWHRQQRPGDWLPRRGPEGELDRFHPGGLGWGARRVRGVHQRPHQRRHPVRSQPVQRPRRVLGDRTAVDAVQPRRDRRTECSGRDETLEWWNLSGQVGGPVLRDRAWFFGGVDYYRQSYRSFGFTGPRTEDEPIYTQSEPRVLREAVDRTDIRACASRGSSSASTARRVNDNAGPGVTPEATSSTQYPQAFYNLRCTWQLGARTLLEARYGGFNGRRTSGPASEEARTARPRTAIRPPR